MKDVGKELILNRQIPFLEKFFNTSKIDLEYLMREEKSLLLYTCAVLSKIRVFVELAAIDSEVSKKEVMNIRKSYIHNSIEKLKRRGKDLNSDFVDIFEDAINGSFKVAALDHGDSKIDCKEELKRIRLLLNRKEREAFYSLLTDFTFVDGRLDPNESEFLKVAKQELEI